MDIKVLQQDLVFNMVPLQIGLLFLVLVMVFFLFYFLSFFFFLSFLSSLTGKKKKKKDINECLVNNGGCDINANCFNTIGSRNYTCKTGYSGDGFNCDGMIY